MGDRHFLGGETEALGAQISEPQQSFSRKGAKRARGFLGRGQDGDIQVILLVGLLLLAPAAWGIDPPDSVWVESVGYEEGTGGFVTLGFPAVEGAAGYRIYRMLAVTHVLGENGDVVRKDGKAWVPWAAVTDEHIIRQDTIRVRIITLDTDRSPMGVSAFVLSEDGEEILSDRVVVFVEGIYHPADFNQDGQIDFADFFLFADNFASGEVRFDLNGNGQVTLEDYFLFVGAFQEGPVPAP